MPPLRIVLLAMSITILGSYSCGKAAHKKDPTSESTYIKGGEISFQPIYTKHKEGNDFQMGHHHFLRLTGYVQNDYQLYTKALKLARNYVDTISVDTPVFKIFFQKSMNGFPSDMDNEHMEWKTIFENTIIGCGFQYINDPLMPKGHYLQDIYTYENGTPRTIRLNSFSSEPVK